jgi:alpha-aminoadipate/glutamate carrier protein LysW
MATCPSCDADLDFDEFEVDEDEIISCGECNASLRVASTSPLELEVLDEDDDEDDDEDEEEEEDELGEDDDDDDDDEEDDEDEGWEE